MTEDETEHVCTYWLSFLQHWQGLFQVFQGAGIDRWKMRPKHHYFLETIKQIRRTQLNIRCVSCWQDESYLGHVKKIAIHSHGGNAILRTFQRLMINLSRRFKNTRDHSKEVEQFGCPKVATPTWMTDSLPVWTGSSAQKLKPSKSKMWSGPAGRAAIVGFNIVTFLWFTPIFFLKLFVGYHEVFFPYTVCHVNCSHLLFEWSVGDGGITMLNPIQPQIP